MRLPETLPRPRLALLVGVCALLAGAAALAPAYTPVVPVALALLLAAVAADARLLPRPSQLRLERRVSPVLSHAAVNRVVVTVENLGAQAADVEIEEVWPPTLAPARHRLRARVAAGGRAELTYHVTPSRRGPLTVPAAAVRVRGPLGLLARQRGEALASSSLRVYPDVAGVGRYELAARRHLSREMGIRATRLRGSGTEIEGLREYTRDDEYRRIDWKATARRGRPMTREMADEKSQHVMLMVDAGRLGAAELGGARRLDHALNASLVLAHVAAGRGDRVGVMVFDRVVRRYLPPGRASRAVVPALARALFDVEARPVESDYEHAFRTLAVRDRRRALVVLFTDVLSPEASQALVAHMAQTAARHLPVCVAIDDPALAQAAHEPVGDAASVYRRAAAIEIRAEREAALRAMRERGVLVVDVPPAALTSSVVNRYLDLKARRLL